MIAAIGLSSIFALAAIITTSSTSMNNSLLAQEAMSIQTKKHQEDLEMIISNNLLKIKNVGTGTITLKEIRILSGSGSIVSKKTFPHPGLEITTLAEYSYTASDLATSDLGARTVTGITDLGNIFTATNVDKILLSISESNTNDAKAMMEGMGLYSRIIQTSHHGRIIYGQNVAGIESSLKPYNAVPATTNFAAQILDTDTKVVVPIPKFNAQYKYIPEQQLLQQTSPAPSNILSYSQQRIVGGAASVSQNSGGITFSGTGTIILKLNDFGGKLVVFEGSVPTGASLMLSDLGSNNIMTLPYDNTFGWNVWNSPYNSIHPTDHLHSGCYSPYAVTQTVLLLPNKQVSPQYTVKRLLGTTYHTPTVATSVSDGQLSIQSVSESKRIQFCYRGLLCGDHTCTWGTTEYNFPSIPPPYTLITGTVIIFDKDPVNKPLVTFESNYQMAYTFPQGKQLYLVAKPNGQTFTLKASAFNSQTMPYLKITNLPPNTPYEIVKDGHVSSRGMTQSDGSMSLFLGDVDIKGTNQGGILRLYPDAAKHRGPFSTVVFDNLNGKTIHVPSQDKKIYVAHAYVQIPVTGNIVVSETNLDNILPLQYIDGNYTTGDRIRVPIIPGYKNVNLKINGNPTITAISDVLGGTGLKVIESGTSTITQHKDSDLVTSITATTGSIAFVVPTAEGTLTTSITATISGTSQIDNYAYFTAPPPPPPPPGPRDPLKAYVETYKNGKFVTRDEIYFNPNPAIENTSSVGGTSSKVSAKYSYPQTVIHGVLTTNVEAGDMVEFYLYANIYADGPVPPIPAGYTFQNYAGVGTATATIHGGSILSS
jgi:hypothetical protein